MCVYFFSCFIIVVALWGGCPPLDLLFQVLCDILFVYIVEVESVVYLVADNLFVPDFAKNEIVHIG